MPDGSLGAKPSLFQEQCNYNPLTAKLFVFLHTFSDHIFVQWRLWIFHQLSNFFSKFNVLMKTMVTNCGVKSAINSEIIRTPERFLFSPSPQKAKESLYSKGKTGCNFLRFSHKLFLSYQISSLGRVKQYCTSQTRKSSPIVRGLHEANFIDDTEASFGLLGGVLDQGDALLLQADQPLKECRFILHQLLKIKGIHGKAWSPQLLQNKQNCRQHLVCCIV